MTERDARAFPDSDPRRHQHRPHGDLEGAMVLS
jgi:hypothetical protein